MKTNVTTLKFSLIALFVLISSSAWSATFYSCINTPLTLSGGTPPAGATFSWDVKKDGVQFAGYPNATAPTAFAEAGSYEVILNTTTAVETGACPADPVSNTIIVLPPLTLAIGTPSVPAYCEANGAVTSSVIAATTTGVLPAASPDLGLTYTYSVSKDGAAGVDGATLGTIDAATGAYTLNTVAPGVYVITGTVKYSQLGTNTLLGTGCPVSSTTQTVTVTPKPVTPTVTIAAAP
jgi:hypothetical protein